MARVAVRETLSPPQLPKITPDQCRYGGGCVPQCPPQPANPARLRPSEGRGPTPSPASSQTPPLQHWGCPGCPTTAGRGPTPPPPDGVGETDPTASEAAARGPTAVGRGSRSLTHASGGGSARHGRERRRRSPAPPGSARARARSAAPGRRRLLCPEQREAPRPPGTRGCASGTAAPTRLCPPTLGTGQALTAQEVLKDNVFVKPLSLINIAYLTPALAHQLSANLPPQTAPLNSLFLLYFSSCFHKLTFKSVHFLVLPLLPGQVGSTVPPVPSTPGEGQMPLCKGRKAPPLARGRRKPPH